MTAPPGVGHADVFSPAKRSAVMAAVKGKNTKPEMQVRRTLHQLGYRYRLHDTSLPGAPDLVFPGRRAVVFVHGCFWHGHDCPRGARTPKTNRAYWIAKIARNVERDAKRFAQLAQMGWRTHVVWECELRTPTWIDRVCAHLDARQRAPNGP